MNETPKNGLKLAFLGLLAALLTVPVSFSVAQEDIDTTDAITDDGELEENQEEIRRVEVTGSRIKRIDMESVSPVISLSRDDLETTGFTTVGDALRSLPFNNGQALSPADAGTSFTPGVSSLNLRGLGNNNSLLLVNGRRVPPYATPGFDGFQSVFDLNSLPTEAIERIDILKDGASAIYGSDAVAGVVNVILRDDFEGLSLVTEIGDYFETGGLFRSLSGTFGTRSGKTSLVTTFSMASQDAVFARDLDYAEDANKEDFGPETDARYTFTFSEEEIIEAGLADSAEAYQESLVDQLGAPGIYADLRSSRNIPGYITVPEDTTASDGTFFAAGRYTTDGLVANPTSGDLVAGQDFYNYQEENGLFPSWTTYSFYTRATHDFSDTLIGFAEFSFSRWEGEIDSAPTPADIESSNGLTPNEDMFLPGPIPYDYDGDGVDETVNPDTGEPFYQPFNPTEVDITNGRRRLLEAGNRINDVTSDTPRVLTGLSGEIGFSWEWEAAAMYSKNTVSNSNVNVVPDFRLQQAMLGLTEAGDGSLSYDPSTRPEDRVYFNWFGENSPEMADYLNRQNPVEASFELIQYDAEVTGEIFDLPAGPLGVAFGVERREEDFENIQSELNANGDILGGSEGQPSAGDRTVDAVFAEVAIPVTSMIEAQIAGRYEDYSDEGLDAEIRPKFGISFRPTDWLLLRGSYSESFKAPDLAFLFSSGTTSFTSFQVIDPVTGTEIDQLQIQGGGNPDLAAEETDTWYAGLVIEPNSGPLDGFRLGVDYFKFESTNLIAQLSDFFGFTEFLRGAAEGDPLFADKVVRDPITDEVLFIRDTFENLSERTYEGYDFTLAYENEYAWGNFRAQLLSTYLESLTLDEDEFAGDYLNPEWRHNLTLAWQKGDWSASIYTTYIGERDRSLFFFTPVEGNDVFLTYTIDSQIVVNPQVSYDGLWDTRITVGVNNVFDENPPEDLFQAAGFTPGVNIGTPAFWYFRIGRDF